MMMMLCCLTGYVDVDYIYMLTVKFLATLQYFFFLLSITPTNYYGLGSVILPINVEGDGKCLLLWLFPLPAVAFTNSDFPIVLEMLVLFIERDMYE